MFASLLSMTGRKSAYTPRRAYLEDRAVPSTFWMECLSSVGALDHTAIHATNHGVSTYISRSSGEEIPQQ